MPAYKDTKRKTWYVKMSQTVDGKRRQILKRGFATKRDALDWEADQRGSKAPDSYTFRQVMDMYYLYNQPKEKTRDHQIAMLEKHFPYVDKDVLSIKKADLMRWYIGLQRKDLKPSTMNLILSVVKSVFKYGADFYELPNPSLGLKRIKQPARKYETWSPEEFNQFIKAVDKEIYRALFKFIYYTGCRKSEALSLRYGDFTDTTVHIRGTKTEQSDRVLKLAPALRDDLKAVLERCDDDHPIVFPIPSVTLQLKFKGYTEASGVKPIRIHDLRHSFATNLIGSGANIVAVSKYLGHSNVNQTLRTYTHLFEEADDDLINRINGIISVSNSSEI